MKLTHKLLVFFVLAVAISSCFDPPEFPTTPEIEFEGIYFGETPEFTDPDSIFLRFNFKDGDGNIGIGKMLTTNDEVIDNLDDPFHDSNFYLSEGGNSLKEIGTVTFYTDTFTNQLWEFVPLKVISRRNQVGKLITYRNQAGYSNLPNFTPSKLNCVNYTVEDLYIFLDNTTPSNQANPYNLKSWYGFTGDGSIVDASYSFKGDTLRDAFLNRYLHLKDTVYFQVNPTHYSIEVDFLVKEPAHPDADASGFREYDWRKEFCTTYDGRFSQLSDTNTPLEGTIGYSMVSTGFRSVFSVKTLKLRISIKDRDFNVSNLITTPEFTLDKIKLK